jgi:putative ABC transport system ATP-binding protein
MKKTELIKVSMAFPTYKPFRRENTEFSNKIQKRLRKYNSIIKRNQGIKVEELNQFVFATYSTNNMSLQNSSTSVKLENDILKIYEKFSKRILDKYQKIIQKDPEYRLSTRIFSQATKNYDGLQSELKELTNLPEKVRGEISDLFMKSQLILWDHPGDQIDRIIIGQSTIEHINGDMKIEDIDLIADELTLASLAKNHVPLIVEKLRSIKELVDGLKRDIPQITSSMTHANTQLEKNQLVESCGVFVGKLLGIREPVLLAQKQLERYILLHEEISEESKNIDSIFFEDLYKKLVDLGLVKDTIEQIDDMLNSIASLSIDFRAIYSHFQNLEIGNSERSKTKDFLKLAIKIYYNLEDFRFITDTFQDVPSFTSMSGNINVSIKDSMDLDQTVIYVEKLFKTFQLPTSTVYAVRGVDLEVKKGELVAIMGPSGSGKTTLLNILSGLDKPDTGAVIVAGLDITRAKEKDLLKFRREKVSFIYQTYNLLPGLKNRENVQLPADLGGAKIKSKKQIANHLLEDVELLKYSNGYPLRLSGGQQQRVAIARSLMTTPEIIFADEPTGNLDSSTGSRIMDIIEKFHRQNVTIVIVTHDQKIANRADRIIYMSDGKIVDNVVN